MAYVVGLTGGIGSGKSTVCDLLALRGAKIIDADAIVHELQQPGTEVFDQMVQAFGSEILSPDGTLDRSKLGSIVFSDPEKRKLLESIVWPAVGVRVAEQLQALGDDDVAVLDVPLMAEAPQGSRRNANTIVVVDAAPETQIRHLEDKGVSGEVARARMAAQASREERLKIADHVLTNDGSLDELEKQVDELWRVLQEAARKDTN
jgi:dephospho-CoA kinase